MSIDLRAIAGPRGALSYRRILAAGWSPQDIERMTKTGELRCVRRGAYVLAAALEGGTPEEHVAARVAAILAARDDERAKGGSSPVRPKGSRHIGRAALARPDLAAYECALALSGLPLHRPDESVVDLMSDTSRVRLRAGVRLHPIDRVPIEDYLAFPDGARALCPALALAQIMLRSGGLHGLVPLDAALHTGVIRREEVGHALTLLTDNPTKLARGAADLARADEKAESPGETQTRPILDAARLRYESQYVIREGRKFVAKVDFLIEDKAALEYDGLVKYRRIDRDESGRPLSPEEIVIREKRREDAIRRLGYPVVRIVYADLVDPRRFLAELRAKLRAA